MQKKLWMRLVWWFRRAWLMRTPIFELGRSHWEGYETGTRAAAKGGITTMIEMPLNQLPATVDRASIELKFDAAKGKLTIHAAQLGGLVS